MIPQNHNAGNPHSEVLLGLSYLLEWGGDPRTSLSRDLKSFIFSTKTWPLRKCSDVVV